MPKPARHPPNPPPDAAAELGDDPTPIFDDGAGDDFLPDPRLEVMTRQMARYHERIDQAGEAFTLKHYIYRLIYEGETVKARPLIGTMSGPPPDIETIANKFGAGAFRVITRGYGPRVRGVREEKVYGSPEIIVGDEWTRAAPPASGAPGAPYSSAPVRGSHGLTLPMNLTGENARMLETLAMFEALIMLNGRLTNSVLPFAQAQPATAPVDMLALIKGLAPLFQGGQARELKEIRALLTQGAGDDGLDDYNAPPAADAGAAGGMLGSLLSSLVQPALEKAVAGMFGKLGPLGDGLAAGASATIPRLLGELQDPAGRARILKELKGFTGSEKKAEDLATYLEGLEAQEGPQT